MRIEFIELLRCPANHELSPLITVANKRDGDHLLDAVLGCVVCGAEFEIRDGVAYLTDETAMATIDTIDTADVIDPMRIAALLSLTDASARALLCGAAASVSHEIESLTGARVASVNAPAPGPGLSMLEHELVDVIRLTPGAMIPLATASLQGLAVDERHASLLADAARVVQRGGRVLGPLSAAVPLGCRELARDSFEWVAEVEVTPSAPISLKRATEPRS